MQTMSPFRSLSTLLLSAAALAQVPVGFAVNGAIGTSPTPLILLDRTPVVTTITGGLLANVNSVRIDPIDGRLWMTSTAGGTVNRGAVDLTTNTVVGETTVATLPTGSLAAIAFDIDCNPVVVGGSLTTTGGAWIVNRFTGAVTQIISSAAGLTGTVNAIDEDAATGDLYFGVFGTGNVYRISPPYALNSQVLVGTISGPSNTSLSGVSFARPPANPTGILYISAFNATANASLVTMDPGTGIATAVAGSPNWPDLNWVDYDEVRNDLWVNSTFAAASIYSSTTAGANATLHTITGTPAAVEVNDVDTTTAVVLACPMNVPVPTGPTPLELSVHGNPGEIGVIAIVRPVLTVIGLGPVGRDGRFSLRIPGLVYPSGSPNSIGFLGGTVDTSTLAVKISAPLGWPRN